MNRPPETDNASIRRRIIELLEIGPQDARTLSQQLHQSEKEIYAHLDHVDRSLKARGRRLVIEPPVCLGCGFVFKERNRPNPPGHCPRCHKTRIQKPCYVIA
ncbi:MAG: transcriptional regulator [Desulfobulbus sp.]|jgi:predicted Zn-ribbon and HTH transcriptional regulator|uniref:transcriptional regulator n=1 Tax=Desulfobulbus sp. TaxID=895 RepID=UPI00283F0A1C|nr:transcriptional regulator [Desulfobulbus sp.]MDR2549202.1 transcriptional regulator [Desulfobulbus sp.]